MVEANLLVDAAFRPVIVAPTYNNAGTLAGLLVRAAKWGVSIIAVNDGSNDKTGEILKELAGQLDLTIFEHAENRGKAAALLTGFASAKSAGFTHALTIDTDDQHDPELIPILLESARENIRALILGTRDSCEPGYPFRSRFGRAISNSLIWMESGLRVSDSQCGMRVYPLGLVSSMRCRAGRYGWEAEILTRATWGGWAVIERQINCTYLPPERRVSHFRPLWDSVTSLVMHARLLPEGLMRIVGRIGNGQSAERVWQDIGNEAAGRS
jgi:glycosyltransferase involved in cell wall biosynthesis